MACKPIHFQTLAWSLLPLLDSGEFDGITVSVVRKHAEMGTIKSFLKEHLGSKIDTSLLSGEEWVELSDEWERMANTIDTRRKFGVHKKGIALLLAYSLQSLQNRLVVD